MADLDNVCEFPTRPARPTPRSGPVTLIGLIACRDDGSALGVVQEVLGYDGRTLRLRLLREALPGGLSSHVEVEVPVSAAPGALDRAPGRRSAD